MPWLCTMFLIYFKDVHVKWCWYQTQAYTWWRHMKQWSAWFRRRGFSVWSPAHCRPGHKTVHAVFMHLAIDSTWMQEKGEKPTRSLAYLLWNNTLQRHHPPIRWRWLDDKVDNKPLLSVLQFEHGYSMNDPTRLSTHLQMSTLVN